MKAGPSPKPWIAVWKQTPSDIKERAFIVSADGDPVAEMSDVADVRANAICLVNAINKYDAEKAAREKAEKKLARLSSVMRRVIRVDVGAITFEGIPDEKLTGDAREARDAWKAVRDTLAALELKGDADADAKGS